jgi:peptidoglycan/xylan/chitin deacetylase (PgdA/CDA1 family)
MNAMGSAPGHGSVLVLAYHAIADLPAGSSLRQYAVPPAEFAAQVDALQRAGYEFVDLGAVLAALDGTARVPARAALVTFDDCSEDLRTVAAPLLAARGIPAVAFAVAGRLGGANEWEDPGAGEPLRLLDAEALRGLGRLGIEVGAHSLSHPRLTEIDPARLTAEIAGSRERLQAAGLPAPRAFAYPYGASNPAVAAAVRDAGFLAGFSTESGMVSSASDRYRLPRMELRRGDTGTRFRLRVASAQAPAFARRAIRARASLARRRAAP